MGLTSHNQYIKTAKELDLMRKGGVILGDILNELKSMIVPGVNSMELENTFINLCKKNKVEPACKGYSPYYMPPFPTGLCLSINNQCVHCYPKKSTVITDSDVVTVDTVIKYGAVHVDSSFALSMPKASAQKQNLVRASQEALNNAISKVSDGIRIGVISDQIYKTAKKYGFNVLKDFAGHGIGYEMHEWPEIPCYGDKHSGAKLKAGMTICIESLLCTGSDVVDNISAWETKMRDDGYFAQFEHTILVTKDGYEILTEGKK